MEVIKGKILLFTDLHLGLAGNSVLKLNIAIRAIKEIIEYIKRNGISEVLFLGDWNHSRVTTENNVLNVSYKLMSALAKHAHVRLIVGNHDIYMKNSVDINSLVIFKDLENVDIVDKPTEMLINGKAALLAPWLSDMTLYSREQFDLLFGHFDVTSKYLIQSYIQEHKTGARASEASMNVINDTLGDASQNNPGDLVGDFVDTVKPAGTIFSGHIHGRKEFLSKGRKFVFVGSPYQQNLGEKDNLCGFYILNEDATHEFHEVTSTPKHIQLSFKDIQAAGVDAFDFSKVAGNIVQKIYDIEADRILDAQVSQKIADLKPFEELLPEYVVDAPSSDEDSTPANEAVELLKKSKLEYIQNYVNNIDNQALENDGLDRAKLFSTLEKYYTMVS